MRITFRLLFVVLSTYFMFSLTLQAQVKPKRKIIMPTELAEISGLVLTNTSKTPTFLALNDGGNAPYLYEMNGNQIQKTIQFPKNIQNEDWEDLCQDKNGNLYLGDFGNNLNERKNLRIYVYNTETQRTDSITFTYPDQKAFPPPLQKDWNFDCEAMVFYNDSLHLFTKNRFVGNFYTKHYTLPAKPGQYVAQFRDSISLKNQVVTGAAVSADGKTLALVTYYFALKHKFRPVSRTSIWFFNDYKGSRFLQGKMTKQRIRKVVLARQVESVTHFDGRYWLVGNERMKFNRASVRRVRER
jgi:hypothetical protein